MINYDEYLRSPEWHARRAAVLERAGGICECCRSYPAEHVHHLTYEHLGSEPLWDLRAVCSGCHGFLHGKNTPVVPGEVQRKPVELQSVEDLLAQVVSELKQPKPAARGVSTCNSELDIAIGGFRPGHVTVFGAKRGFGKTSYGNLVAVYRMRGGLLCGACRDALAEKRPKVDASQQLELVARRGR